MPVLADLPQIGADGGLHQIDEAAQDAVFVERGDGFELLLDLGKDRRLACRALGVGGDEARVEAGPEQSDKAGGDRGVLAQSLPHIVLAERCADLAQIARERPDGRDFAPAQGCPQNQGVVAVGFGAIPTTAMIEASRRWLNSVLITIGWPSLASIVISCSHTGAGAGLSLGTI